MNWRAKAHLLAIASRAPGGRALYRHYQDRQASSLKDADEMFGRALDLIALYRESGVNIEQRQCLEIGTGWCPWVPILLTLSGARSVFTLDVNPWLSHRTALGTTQAVRERAARVASALGITERAVVERLGPAIKSADLAGWLRTMNVVYRCVDLRGAGLPSARFDVIFSSNVLEHVEPNELAAIHRDSWRLLRDGGRIVHRFNPQDHFSTGDRAITGANFLQFSADEWTWLGGSGLSYHNRLRCPQHRSLIVESGFDVAVLRTRPDGRAQRAIESGELRVHPDFSGFNAVELSDDYMWVVGVKSDAIRETHAGPRREAVHC